MGISRPPACCGTVRHISQFTCSTMIETNELSRRDLVGAMALSILGGALGTAPAAGAMAQIAGHADPAGGGTMTLDEYSSHDAVGLAELVRRRQIGPRELAQTALAAIAAVNPKINAVVETFPERAASATGSGPLGGVP